MSPGRMGAARWLALLIGGLAATLFMPSRSHATEDGGTTSMFTQGAGNRALALGGAFTAVADDASGWMWNPAGLGRVGRGEFQTSQASYGELGGREVAAGFAMPNWRWGAIAASYRQFGVDDLEARDDRNVVVGTGLTSRESEFAFGYGRTLPAGWSVGAVAKVRRQSIVGRAATGVGADLGITFSPALALSSRASMFDDLTLGLAFQNVLAPAVRLDLDEVVEPRTTRAGLAWRPPGIGFAPTLATLDLEATGGRSARLHAGLQVSAHPMMDLRLGVNGSRLTGGTGLTLGSLLLDYAFEDGPLVPVHRVGLSMRFGSTVSESREAASRAREDEIQGRLAKAFDAQQKQRVEELVARAERARAAGNCIEALDVIAALRALAPDDRRIPLLESRCTFEQGAERERQGDLTNATLLYSRALVLAPGDTALTRALNRVRALSDRWAARSSEIRRKFTVALDAFGAGDLSGARRDLRAILEQQPGDADARAMLSRVERAIAQRVTELLDQAERLARSGLLDDARTALAAARALDPGSVAVARTAALIQQADRAATPEPRAPVRPG
ncbi:MAG: hypothetical protein HOP12_02395, partial [Candidatus Eisenbacteria bacterium]|nr:hypothetical protein [Candidatus Eisenbacteria bacterium]